MSTHHVANFVSQNDPKFVFVENVERGTIEDDEGVLDAIRTNRTDGALVRIIAPITTTDGDAERQAVGFAEALYPLLGRYLPS